jgi:hypothetical protein
LDQNPLVEKVFRTKVDGFWLINEVFGEIKNSELECVPNLVAKLSVADNSFDIQVNISGLHNVRQQGEPESV